MPCVTTVYETQHKAHCVLSCPSVVARRSYIVTACSDLWIMDQKFYSTAPRSRPTRDRVRLRRLFIEYGWKGKSN